MKLEKQGTGDAKHWGTGEQGKTYGGEAGTYVGIWKVKGNLIYDGLESFAMQEGEYNLWEWRAMKRLQVKEWHDQICVVEILDGG